MASKGTFDMGPVLVLVVALLLSPRAMAQSGCTNVLISMAPCLNYVTGSSATPSSTCCASLANVVRSQPRCLCTALDGGGSALGVNINRTLALAMPTACNVQTPPVSRCNGENKCIKAVFGSTELECEMYASANGPTISPTGPPEAAPGGSSDETPDSQNDPSVSGSKTVPSNDSTPNIGITIEIPLQLLTLFLFMASYASAFSSF